MKAKTQLSNQIHICVDLEQVNNAREHYHLNVPEIHHPALLTWEEFKGHRLNPYSSRVTFLKGALEIAQPTQLELFNAAALKLRSQGDLFDLSPRAKQRKVQSYLILLGSKCWTLLDPEDEEETATPEEAPVSWWRRILNLFK